MKVLPNKPRSIERYLKEYCERAERDGLDVYCKGDDPCLLGVCEYTDDSYNNPFLVAIGNVPEEFLRVFNTVIAKIETLEDYSALVRMLGSIEEDITRSRTIEEVNECWQDVSDSLEYILKRGFERDSIYLFDVPDN